MNIDFYKKNKVIIVGKFKGYGGVQSVHKNLLDTYKKLGYEVLSIYNIKSFLSFLLKGELNVKIVYFSGLSLFFSPIFFCCKKHVFLMHGFYVFEGFKKNITRTIKKIIYEKCTSLCLFFYRWVYCIAPSPISALLNSSKYSRNVGIVHWGVSDYYLNYPINDKKYNYHLVFLGRPNCQKLNISSLNLIINLFVESKIVYSAKDLKIAFMMPKDNIYSSDLIKTIEDKYECSIYKYYNFSDFEICKILSQALYYFNCFEWEAFGITNIEALCMGCNILIPSTSPIIPMVDNLIDSPVYKYNPPTLLNQRFSNKKFILAENRQNSQNVKYFRSVFNWRVVINDIHKMINFSL